MELKTEVRKIWPDMALGDEISSGSYGQVFNADWNGTEYALKAVRLRLTDSEYAALPPVQHIPDDSNEIAPKEPLRAYLNEVRILRRLRHHPHIVWIEDSAVLKLENEPSCYLLILMEKLESCTEYISRCKITEDLRTGTFCWLISARPGFWRNPQAACPSRGQIPISRLK